MSKPVGPFWRYYGGKWRAAPRYPAPQLEAIVEPFAGAAGYACRYPWRKVILIDRSPVIAGIWRFLIGSKPEDILAIPDIPEGGTVDDLDVCQEARWLAGFWCNLGAASPGKTPTAWTDIIVDGTQKWGWCLTARQRIARDVPRIAHWQVIEGDYTDAPDVEATWFIDPPYQTKAGRHYKEQPDDFAALGEWTQRRKGQVIACDQQGADWLPWSSEISLKANAATGTSEEVIYHRSWQPGLFPTKPPTVL